MRANRLALVAFVAAITSAPALVAADPGGVVRESGRTAGHAARDGVLTLHRTVGAFLTHGPRTAKYTWKANAARTNAEAHAGAARIKYEAHDER